MATIPKGRRPKKNGKKSDIVTLAFDPSPPSLRVTSLKGDKVVFRRLEYSYLNVIRNILLRPGGVQNLAGTTKYITQAQVSSGGY